MTSRIKKKTCAAKRGRTDDPRDVLLNTINDKLQAPSTSQHTRDRFDVAGENIAMKLRSLSVNQRIMSEKLINDVLFEAECNNLNRNWKLVDGAAATAVPNFHELRPAPSSSNFHTSHNFNNVSQLFQTFDPAI